MARAIERLRQALRSGDHERARTLARECSDILLPAPIAERLLQAPEEARLLLLLHGVLEALPVATLTVNEHDLDGRWTPHVLPGLPAVRPGEPMVGNAMRWTLLGAPVNANRSRGGDVWPELPGAARELAHLARQYPDAVVRTGTAFTRASLLEALRDGHALHVATHLVTDVQCGGGALAPVGLLVSNGAVLCAEDVLLEAAPKALVVLAACATGDGTLLDAEGLFGPSSRPARTISSSRSGPWTMVPPSTSRSRCTARWPEAQAPQWPHGSVARPSAKPDGATRTRRPSAPSVATEAARASTSQRKRRR